MVVIRYNQVSLFAVLLIFSQHNKKKGSIVGGYEKKGKFRGEVRPTPHGKASLSEGKRNTSLIVSPAIKA